MILQVQNDGSDVIECHFVLHGSPWVPGMFCVLGRDQSLILSDSSILCRVVEIARWIKLKYRHKKTLSVFADCLIYNTCCKGTGNFTIDLYLIPISGSIPDVKITAEVGLMVKDQSLSLHDFCNYSSKVCETTGNHALWYFGWPIAFH